MKKLFVILITIITSTSIITSCGKSSSNTESEPEKVESTKDDSRISEKTDKNKTQKPKDVGVLAKNKKLSDGSTAYLDGNTLKVVSSDGENASTIYYVFENDSFTMYAEIECDDEETAKLISDMYNSQENELSIYSAHAEGSVVHLSYNDEYEETFSTYTTAEQIYDLME